MARYTTKIGDVFSVKIAEDTKKYFQYVVNDQLQLNSSVIRAFKKTYPIDAHPDLRDVVNDEMEFYAHVILSWGLKMGLWEKAGNINILGNINLCFSESLDYGTKKGEKPVTISSNWRIWHINDPEFTHVCKLEGEFRHAEIGLIRSPNNIVERIKSGKYPGSYPTFE